MLLQIKLKFPAKAPHCLMVLTDPFSTQFADQIFRFFETMGENSPSRSTPRFQDVDGPLLLFYQLVRSCEPGKSCADD